jgi:hypothetical protein
MEKLKALTRRLAHRGFRSSLIKEVSTWGISSTTNGLSSYDMDSDRVNPEA